MFQIECLSHRGFWDSKSKQNTRDAFERSFVSGFGIETDLRDHQGSVVISHDPPGTNSNSIFRFEDLLSLYRECNSNATLALNVKSDGLAEQVKALLHRYEVNRYFVFDASIPDMLMYLKLGLNFFQRQSELEVPLDAMAAKLIPTLPCGIWLDSFFGNWYSPQLIKDHLDSGVDVCVVSPELHGRRPHLLWDALQSLVSEMAITSETGQGRLMLCTDHPRQFADSFNEKIASD